MPSQPNESAAEDVRNALQLLKHHVRAIPSQHHENGPDYVVDWPTHDDIRAAQVRLESALVKIADLEGLAIGRREQELAIMQDRAAYIAREFAPLDYPVPAVEDRALGAQNVVYSVDVEPLEREVSRLAAALTESQQETEKWRDAEERLSEAYLRLRRILNAWDTPRAPTGEQVWAVTEAKARALQERVEDLEADLRNDVLTVEIERDALRAQREALATTLRKIVAHRAAVVPGFPKTQGEAEAFYDVQERARAVLAQGEEPPEPTHGLGAVAGDLTP